MRLSLRKISLCIGLILLAATIYWTSTHRITSNFHTVVEGKVYRSAQPLPSELESWVKKYGLKSVINLRGAQHESEWYIKERETLKKLNVKLYNVGYGSGHVPQPHELKKLLIAFAYAPKPILIHCRIGADRTGEASALYKLVFEHSSVDEAIEMLSPKYLHLSFLTPSKSMFLHSFKGIDWALNDYDPCLHPFVSYYDEDWCHRGPLEPITKTSHLETKQKNNLEFIETWNVSAQRQSWINTLWDD